MVSIYETFKKSEIAFIKSLSAFAEKYGFARGAPLIDAGIPFFIDNENAAGIAVGQTTGFMSVMVPESEEERSKEILEEVIS